MKRKAALGQMPQDPLKYELDRNSMCLSSICRYFKGQSYLNCLRRFTIVRFENKGPREKNCLIPLAPPGCFVFIYVKLAKFVSQNIKIQHFYAKNLQYALRAKYCFTFVAFLVGIKRFQYFGVPTFVELLYQPAASVLPHLHPQYACI